MTEEIFSNGFFYYGKNDKSHFTFTVRMVTKDPVNPESVEYAAAKAMERYSYIKKRLCRNWNKLWLEDNDLPVVVKKGSKSPVLGTDESNHHLIAVSYDENSIYLHAFHGLIDGCGSNNIIRTLIYYYILHRYGIEIKHNGFRLIGDEIEEEEYIDPFPRKAPGKDIIPKGKTPRFISAMSLSEELKRMGRSCEYHPSTFMIHVAEEELHRVMAKHEATPISLMSVLMARAVDKVTAGSRKAIGIGIPINFRPALNANKCYRSLIYSLHVIYDEKIKRLPFDKQCKAVRGRVRLQSNRDSVINELEFQRKIFNVINGVPFLPLKRTAAKIIQGLNMGDETFLISYAGRAQFGEAENYIEYIGVDVDPCGCDILLEISLINGVYSVDIIQRFEDSIYIDAFVEELKREGVKIDLFVQRDANFPMVKIG